jgi:hypothetical protein
VTAVAIATAARAGVVAATVVILGVRLIIAATVVIFRVR